MEEAEYVYTSTVRSPGGVTVTVTTTVPAGQLGAGDRNLTNDISELTQAGASRTANHIADSFKAHYERCPF